MPVGLCSWAGWWEPCSTVLGQDKDKALARWQKENSVMLYPGVLDVTPQSDLS